MASLQQSKLLLEKINSLYQNITLDGQISSIERDLMLSYVRSFYETILQESNQTLEILPLVTPAATPVAQSQISKPIELSVPVVVAEEVKKTEPIIIQETPQIEPEPTKIEPIIEFKPEPKIEYEKEVTAVIEVIASAPVVAPTPPPAPKVTVAAASKSLIKPTTERVGSNELFEEKMSRELSDRLGELPITDIKRGMGLNERIIFLNELFDSNVPEFEKALDSLNSATNFDEAKQQLMILATRFDWSSKEKHAKAFIRLVKRKHA